MGFVCVLPTAPLCLGHQCAYGSKHRTEWPQFLEVFSGNINMNKYPHILTGSVTVQVSMFCLLLPLTDSGKIFLLRSLQQLVFGSFFRWRPWSRARERVTVKREPMSQCLSQLGQKQKTELVLPGHTYLAPTDQCLTLRYCQTLSRAEGSRFFK